jgi:N-acetylmuramoyl-L-alanine amidase
LKNRDSEDLISRLDRIARNVRLGGRPDPLNGLRVLIDPGHMGSAEWNARDGKYVTIGGKTVAEGEITLWTARLLATELEKLGAEVRLTRNSTNPVTSYTWANFDRSSRLADYYYKSLDDWMAKYLLLNDSELVRELPRAPEVLKTSTLPGKVALFLQEDLDARMKIFDAYRPDLFIDLHFDSQKTNALQSRRNDVSVYVPGAVGKKETGGRNDRAGHLKHLLEVRRWKQSVRFASTLVETVSKRLGVPLLKEDNETMVKVRDGVFARNVHQMRRATSGLSAFFETFHYDHVKEFPRLTNLDRQASYHGTNFRYPARLESISTGLRDGLIQYFREFSE